MKGPLWTIIAAVTFTATAVWGDDAAVPRFAIRQIVLEGNTLLAKDEVARIFERYTGTQKDFGTIQEAMDALEAAYQRRGYTLVSVVLPEQEIERGVVTLKVLEPAVKAIVVDGNRYYSRENILRALPTLRVGAPPRVTAISENLRAANENPSRKMVLRFKNDERDEGLTAQLKVEDLKPWQLSLQADNTGTASTGLYRTGVGLQIFNLFNRDQIIALQYLTSPDHADKVKIFNGSYRLPLYRWGDTLDLFGAYSDVDNGTTQISGTDIKVSGKGIVSGIRYNMNLARRGGYEQRLVAGMDYRLYDNSAVLLGADLARDVVAHPLSLTYGGAWTTDSLSLDGSFGVLYNIPWGGQGQTSDYAAVRSGAKANYTILRYGLNLMGRPGGDWLLRLGLNGQYSPDRLIPGEQFGLGGAASIRGYEEREESWDAGISGVAEIYSPDLARRFNLARVQARLVGFYDTGYGYNLRPQTGEQHDHGLSGTGIGVRLGVGEYLNFSLDWGHALDSSTTTRSGDNRIHFRASVTY